LAALENQLKWITTVILWIYTVKCTIRVESWVHMLSEIIAQVHMRSEILMDLFMKFLKLICIHQLFIHLILGFLHSICSPTAVCPSSTHYPFINTLSSIYRFFALNTMCSIGWHSAQWAETAVLMNYYSSPDCSSLTDSSIRRLLSRVDYPPSVDCLSALSWVDGGYLLYHQPSLVLGVRLGAIVFVSAHAGNKSRQIMK